MSTMMTLSSLLEPALKIMMIAPAAAWLPWLSWTMTIKTESSEEVSLTNFQWAQIEGNEFVHVAQIGVVKNDNQAAIENKCCACDRRRFSSAFV